MNSSRCILKFSNRPECMKQNDNQQYVNLIIISVTPVLESVHVTFFYIPILIKVRILFKTTLPTNKSLLKHLWNCSPYVHLNAKALLEIGIVRHSDNFYKFNISPNKCVSIISRPQAEQRIWD
jgi:hypothetical protein